MNGNESEKSFGELPTLGHEETVKPERPAPEGPSWTALGLSEAETLKPPAGGIVDDGRTDGARRWRPGETILDRYVVEKELGQGGMGVVYGCLDKVGGVRVAVKCLPPELSHNGVEMEEVRENFRLVYGLSHPNIAGVRQLERDEHGEYYLVMEEAVGENLRRWLRAKWKSGGVTLAEATAVLRQVAVALDYAHGKKVVHRDVKPGNVMIDAKGEVKVLDFGLADQIRTSLSRASHAHRGPAGTPPYMSPEQWRGQPQDGKTDQYALGVMAYEMLAGRLPFGSSDLGVLREAVLKEEPLAIPGLPENAMGAILRAMAKRAEERFGSCGEFVEVLEGKRKDRPTARPGQDSDAATAGRQGGAGDVFLRKVRFGRALEAAGREDATARERAELGLVREVFAAGEEALKAGDRAAAERLFAQCEAQLAVWRNEVEGRLERDRGLERARKWTQGEIEEATRKEEKRKRTDATAARRRAVWKVLGVLVLVRVVQVWVGDAVAQKWQEARILAINRRLRAQETRMAGEPKTITLSGGVTMEMAWCPPGAFMMGSPQSEEGRFGDEKRHRVMLTKGFWIAKTEVTQGQWREVMGENPAHFKNGDDYPVESVSWEDCQKFVQALNSSYPQEGLRWAVPTEAEWEYACRAGTEGDCGGTGDLWTMGWYSRNSLSETHPIGQKQPNAWGLHDMHGNVWEWCADCYGAYPSGSVRDPTGPSQGLSRVLRGGSWYSDARNCRSAFRSSDAPAYRFYGLGLRVALLPVQ